jgi:hypothetical protein
MANIVDYLAVAVGGGATVDPQATFRGSGYQTGGFQNGIAQPAQVNKILRQSSMIAAAVATFISNTLAINVLDDGNLPNLITNLTRAIKSANHSILAVAFNAAAQFDAALSDKFETTLTGDMTPTLVDTVPGQHLWIVVHQDAPGNHLFNPPANLPMAAVSPVGGSTSAQGFLVLSSGTIIAVTPMVVS